MKQIELASEQAAQKIRQNLIKNEGYQFVKELDKIIYLPFDEFGKIMIDRYGLYSKDSKIQDDSLILIENYYSIMNAVTFYCDYEKLNTPLSKDKAKDITTVFDMFENSPYDGIVVNISTIPDAYIRINKLTYHIKREKDGKEYKIYSLTITRMEQNDFSSINFYIIPELYPKIFSIDMKTNNSMEVSMIDRQLLQKTQLYIYPYAHRNQNALFQRKREYYFEELLNLLLLCFTRFMNRKKVYKKGKEKHDGIHAKIQTPETTKTNNYRFTPISDICVYERKTGNTVHGHHASPREHKRIGHWRTYKNGHKVWIPECVVNKGGKRGKTIYEIK